MSSEESTEKYRSFGQEAAVGPNTVFLTSQYICESCQGINASHLLGTKLLHVVNNNSVSRLNTKSNASIFF